MEKTTLMPQNILDIIAKYSLSNAIYPGDDSGVLTTNKVVRDALGDAYKAGQELERNRRDQPRISDIARTVDKQFELPQKFLRDFIALANRVERITYTSAILSHPSFSELIDTAKALINASAEEWIEWVEPFGTANEPVYMRVTKEVAIAHQKKTAAIVRKGFVYDSDEQALDDFITVHWAQQK